MSRVLVIEDEAIIRKQISLLLERHNYSVIGASTVEEAHACHPESFDVILADIRLPGAAGTEIIQHSEHVPVIVMTSYASVRSAVESMKLGAVDYISKPFDHDELLMVIERSLRENRLSAQNSAMRRDLQRIFPHREISTEHEPLRQTINKLETLSANERFVYLHGERGTGKELLARLCHETGVRGKGPLVFADLPMYDPQELDDVLFGARDAGVPSVHARTGLLQAAHGGTLVLRGISFLPLALQRKFLDLDRHSTAQKRPLNIRFIALATGTLDEYVQQQKLTVEFSHLFVPHNVQIPPLRERREDLIPLATQYLGLFVKRYRKRKISLSREALNALQAYQWPGNVTELKTVVERAVLMVETEEIKPAHLGIGVIDGATTNAPLNLSLDAYFRYSVLNFQDQLSETELASKLGISRKALWERRQKMDLPRQV